MPVEKAQRGSTMATPAPQHNSSKGGNRRPVKKKYPDGEFEGEHNSASDQREGYGVMRYTEGCVMDRTNELHTLDLR